MERIPILFDRQLITKRLYCENPVGYVYLITNKLNDMSYVGIKFSRIFMPDYWGSSENLTKDIQNVGRKFFSRTILEWCSTVEELYNREVYWINELNLYLGKGYNLSEGGGGGNTWIGHNKEEQKRISRLISKKAKERAKSIVQLTKDFELVRKYNCMIDTENYGFHSASVCNCVRRKSTYKSYKGFIWMYEDEYKKYKELGVFPDFSRISTKGENNPNYKHGKYIGEWEKKRLKRKRAC